ncbi:hypothetical protein HNY73_003408 [Argiope bruennichi]|uniref:Transposase n=1 Tax=Argiope bruennichi TaxID=94029 RepID=A0A8T0FLB3_ARGBR|nr:hypothetical protein HNY73_003408 [Argiope bruennichi]
MSAKHHLSAYDRRRAVGRLEAGQSVTTVAAAKGVISRLKKWKCFVKACRGRGMNITSLEDRYIALVAKKYRNLTPGRIAANLATATGTHVSARTT